MNDNSKINGKGILIYSAGYLVIGYFNDGDHAPGNFVGIWNGGGVLQVAELYNTANGVVKLRGIGYFPDGTYEEYDEWVIILT